MTAASKTPAPANAWRTVETPIMRGYPDTAHIQQPLAAITSPNHEAGQVATLRRGRTSSITRTRFRRAGAVGPTTQLRLPYALGLQEEDKRLPVELQDHDATLQLRVYRSRVGWVMIMD
jgi:hypothetical protein